MEVSLRHILAFEFILLLNNFPSPFCLGSTEVDSAARGEKWRDTADDKSASIWKGERNLTTAEDLGREGEGSGHHWCFVPFTHWWNSPTSTQISIHSRNVSTSGKMSGREAKKREGEFRRPDTYRKIYSGILTPAVCVRSLISFWGVNYNVIAVTGEWWETAL